MSTPARRQGPPSSSSRDTTRPVPVPAVLRDGTAILLRPIEPGDKWRLQAALRLLSERSRYRRFFSPIKELSPEQLRRLTEVDWVDHVAWVAGLPDAQRHPGIGVARYVRLKDEPEVAEAAITVIDDFQNRGLGHVLLHRLAHSAIAGGIRQLRAYVLAENRAMLVLLRELGVTESSYEAGLVRVDVELPASEAELDASAARKLLRMAASGELDFRSPMVSARGFEPPRPFRGTRS